MIEKQPWNHISLTYSNEAGIEKHYQFGFHGTAPKDFVGLFDRLKELVLLVKNESISDRQTEC